MGSGCKRMMYTGDKMLLNFGTGYLQVLPGCRCSLSTFFAIPRKSRSLPVRYYIVVFYFNRSLPLLQQQHHQQKWQLVKLLSCSTPTCPTPIMSSPDGTKCDLRISRGPRRTRRLVY